MQGWIKVHRKMLNSPIWQDSKLAHVWMTCLLKATHKKNDALLGRKKITLKPGQFVTGRRKAAAEMGMSEKGYTSAMRSLVDFGMLKIETSQGQAGTVVSICNWSTYQNP